MTNENHTVETSYGRTELMDLTRSDKWYLREILYQLVLLNQKLST